MAAFAKHLGFWETETTFWVRLHFRVNYQLCHVFMCSLLSMQNVVHLLTAGIVVNADLMVTKDEMLIYYYLGIGAVTWNRWEVICYPPVRLRTLFTETENDAYRK